MQKPDEEDTESIHDKLTRADLIDICGSECTITQPLSILHVYVSPTVVGTYNT